MQKDARANLRIYHLQFLDFSDHTNYTQSFEALLSALQAAVTTAPLPIAANRTPLQQHARPAQQLHSAPQPLARLRDAFFLDGPQRNIGLTALQGMGGIGKTVLAQTLCHDPAVKCAYPDGILWFTIGKESRLEFDERIKAVPGLKRLLGDYQGSAACISQYRNALRDKAALIVLDDVWSAAAGEPFQMESPRSRLLLTTRDAGIAPVSACVHSPQVKAFKNGTAVLSFSVASNKSWKGDSGEWRNSEPQWH